MEVEIVEMAKEVLKKKHVFSEEACILAEYIIAIHQPKPDYVNRLHRKLNALRNHVIEECCLKIETLEGRVRGEINKETASTLRKMKVTL